MTRQGDQNSGVGGYARAHRRLLVRMALVLALLATLALDPARYITHATASVPVTLSRYGRANTAGVAQAAATAGIMPAATLSPGVSNPMVTNLTSSGFTVVFTTNSAVTASVVYGTAPNSLTQTATDDRGATVTSRIHSITLSALLPSTTYYYQLIVGGVTQCPGSPPFFQTTPASESPIFPPLDDPTGLVNLTGGTTAAPANSVVLIGQYTFTVAGVTISSWPVSVLTTAATPDPASPSGSVNYVFNQITLTTSDGAQGFPSPTGFMLTNVFGDESGQLQSSTSLPGPIVMNTAIGGLSYLSTFSLTGPVTSPTGTCQAALPSPTLTPTGSPSATGTATNTPTITNTPTRTPTNTVTNTPTNTATSTVTRTPTASGTPTNTPTITNTPINSPTITNTPTATGTPTASNTATSTVTGTPTATGTVTNTPTVTATGTVTRTPTVTATGTVTHTPTVTATPTATVASVPGCVLRAKPLPLPMNPGQQEQIVYTAPPGTTITTTFLATTVDGAPYPGQITVIGALVGHQTLTGTVVAVGNSLGERYTFPVDSTGHAIVTFTIPADAAAQRVVVLSSDPQPCANTASFVVQ